MFHGKRDIYLVQLHYNSPSSILFISHIYIYPLSSSNTSDLLLLFAFAGAPILSYLKWTIPFVTIAFFRAITKCNDRIYAWEAHRTNWISEEPFDYAFRARDEFRKRWLVEHYPGKYPHYEKDITRQEAQQKAQREHFTKKRVFRESWARIMEEEDERLQRAELDKQIRDAENNGLFPPEEIKAMREELDDIFRDTSGAVEPAKGPAKTTR